MDNLTHSLTGAAVAEGLLAFSPHPERDTFRFRRAAWLVSIAANNLPDLDFLYSWITKGKLGYLLHHRGHTHTLVAALPQALLVFAIAHLLARKTPWTPRQKRLLFLLACLGPCLHLGLDSLNSYGIHPFWPFDNRWIYGDILFIVEPLLWITLAVPLSYVVRSNWARYALVALPVAGVFLSWYTSFVPRAMAILVTVSAAVLFLLGRKRRPRFNAGLALVSSILVVVTFFGFSRYTARTYERLVHSGEELRDLILSPFPANPLCWSFIAVEKHAADYRMVKGLISPVAALGQCPIGTEGEGTAPLTATGKALSLEGLEKIRFAGEFHLPLKSFSSLRANCTVAAFLQYARAPFFRLVGDQVLVGDLRFDREPGLGFAELAVIPTSPTCPQYLPSWKPPRSDLY